MITNCIICPQGCELTVTENGGVVAVTGNKCKRGAEYGAQEYRDPRRTVTSIARLADGGVIPVKTAAPVPKGKIFDVLTEIKRAAPRRPVKIGDIIVKDVCGTAVDVIATKTIN